MKLENFGPVTSRCPVGLISMVGGKWNVVQLVRWWGPNVRVLVDQDQGLGFYLESKEKLLEDFKPGTLRIQYNTD